MKRAYSDLMQEKISEIKARIDIYLKSLGEEKVMEILHNHFALSSEDANELIYILQNMIPGVSYEALPENWFFDGRFPQRVRRHKGKVHLRSRFRDATLKEESPELREEHLEIKKRIKTFMKLPEKLKERALEKWPSDYWDYLLGKEVVPNDPTKTENEKLSAAEIANLILAERWGASQKTIESYVKPGR